MRWSTKATIRLLLFCSVTCSVKSQQLKKSPAKTGLVILNFKHVINGQPLVLDDSSYTNPFGEQYTVHKLKYYVSNFRFYSKGKETFLGNKYFLVNQSVDSSCVIKLQLPPNEYDSLQMMIGVDSAMNTAGAQTGALDPLNDMYWTWQSGYIMQKLEGTSPQSNVVNNKMEYHLGGYGGQFATQRMITFRFGDRPLTIKSGSKCGVVISADIQRFWQGNKPISIKETPVCSSPGMLASALADNFAAMFELKAIENGNQ